MKKCADILTKNIRCYGILLSLAFFAIPANANWLRIETTNFIIYSEEKEEKTVRFLKELELYRQFLIEHGGVSPRGDALKLTIFFPRNRVRYKALTGSGGSVGIFSLTNNGPRAAFYDTTSRYIYRQEGAQILFHEYVHFLQRQSVPTQYPLWYREGFAEYLSSVRFLENGVSLGEILLGRAENLNRIGWLDVQHILEASELKKDGAIFYAQSWLLTHMLYTDQEYRSGISKFLDLLEEDVAPSVALQEVYGIDYAKLGADLKQYFKKGQIFAYQYPANKAKIEIVSRKELGKGESIMLDKSTRLAFAHTERAYEAILKSTRNQLKKSPRNTELNIILIEALLERGQWREAEPIARQLVDDRPDMPEASALLGETILRRAWDEQRRNKADRPNNEKLVEGRGYLETAITALPRNARAQKWYAGSFIYGGHSDFVAAEQAILEAYNLYPQNWQIRRQFADLLYEREDYINACKLYKPLFRTANSEDEKKRLTIRMKYMTDNYHQCQFSN